MGTLGAWLKGTKCSFLSAMVERVQAYCDF